MEVVGGMWEECSFGLIALDCAVQIAFRKQKERCSGEKRGPSLEGGDA